MATFHTIEIHAFVQIWDIECGACLRVLEGHDELVRCIRFDSKRIVSGAYDGKIKIWDHPAALDPRAQASSLCLHTLTEHTGRVFRLQFDDFQIVSSSHDDTILCFNFLQADSNSCPSTSSSPVLGVSQLAANAAAPIFQSQISVQSNSSSSSAK